MYLQFGQVTEKKRKRKYVNKTLKLNTFCVHGIMQSRCYLNMLFIVSWTNVNQTFHKSSRAWNKCYFKLQYDLYKINGLIWSLENNSNGFKLIFYYIVNVTGFLTSFYCDIQPEQSDKCVKWCKFTSCFKYLGN